MSAKSLTGKATPQKLFLFACFQSVSSALIRGKPSGFCDHQITGSPAQPISKSVPSALISGEVCPVFAFPIPAMTRDVGDSGDAYPLPGTPQLGFKST
jgi:hypothetical protein